MHLFAHLLDQHFHIDTDAGEFQRRRFGAQGVGLAVQLLYEEIQAFADVAALFQQALDFVQVGLQPGDFLGHVDPESPLGGASGGGILAGVVYAVVVLVGVVVLLRRYRWVER